MNLVGQSVSQIEKEAQPMIKMYKMDKSQAQQYISILTTKANALTKIKSQKNADQEALNQIETTYEKSLVDILNDDQKLIFENQKIISDNLKKKVISSDSH